ncbi:hypothetical protein ACWEOI_19590 [Nocardia sp. NPDC004340]|uniref:hypothetical protein n=1 Tax=unclassified Nocardia TaxID=2637762 RepID=UPI00365C45C2
MPLVEVTHKAELPETVLRELGKWLPHLVSQAVECPEEPYDGDLQPGDVEIRFRPLGKFDRSGLDVVIEIRSKYFASRADNRQERCDRLLADIEKFVDATIGVYLTLPVAAWAQSE